MSAGEPPTLNDAQTKDRPTPPVPDPNLQWDGDRMFVVFQCSCGTAFFVCCLTRSGCVCVWDDRFNIYIYDYCKKRGFDKTCEALEDEAGVPPLSEPPINAKQGLLFEYVGGLLALVGFAVY